MWERIFAVFGPFEKPEDSAGMETPSWERRNWSDSRREKPRRRLSREEACCSETRTNCRCDSRTTEREERIEASAERMESSQERSSRETIIQSISMETEQTRRWRTQREHRDESAEIRHTQA